MQKEMILEKLREQGCRITKQRQILIDIILEEECSSCKEIYYRAVKKDDRIGTATVYRMVNILEQIGAISRKSMYQVACGRECGLEDVCMVELEDDTVCCLCAREWNEVLRAGLEKCGYTHGEKIRTVKVRQCEYLDETF